MSDKDLSSAIRSIIEKEINKVSKLVPKEALNNIEKNISPQIDQIIEKSGFVKKSKYQNLKDLVDDLEKELVSLKKIKADLDSCLFFQHS